MNAPALIARSLFAIALVAGGFAVLFESPAEVPRLAPELAATTGEHVHAIAWERPFCYACEEMPAGARLIVRVDHAPAVKNVPRSAAEWGQRVLGVAAAGAGRWDIYIEKVTEGRRGEP